MGIRKPHIFHFLVSAPWRKGALVWTDCKQYRKQPLFLLYDYVLNEKGGNPFSTLVIVPRSVSFSPCVPEANIDCILNLIPGPVSVLNAKTKTKIGYTKLGKGHSKNIVFAIPVFGLVALLLHNHRSLFLFSMVKKQPARKKDRKISVFRMQTRQWDQIRTCDFHQEEQSNNFHYRHFASNYRNKVQDDLLG